MLSTKWLKQGYMASILAVLVFMAVVPDCASAFDLVSDRWYYQSDKDYRFIVPDKAQHYYGSYFLTEISKQLTGDVQSSIVVFVLGLSYEIDQSNKGIGFSPRDMIANCLGVISSIINDRNKTLLLNYSTVDKEIMLSFNIPI